MAQNVKLVMEYEGTRFHGWQRQAGATPTVEGSLREALYELTGERPMLIASGRTDAGVHALGQCVNFRLEHAFPIDRLPGALNSRLARDVTVRQAEVVDESFHARYSARARRYEYRIRQHTPRGSYARQYGWSVPESLDIEAMREAGRRLQGHHDFRAFGRSPRPGGHTVRTVHAVEVETDGDWVTIAVTADAFLYGMVRAIAGALVEIGRARRPVQWIDQLLQPHTATARVRPAPPHGLVQVAVEY